MIMSLFTLKNCMGKIKFVLKVNKG